MYRVVVRLAMCHINSQPPPQNSYLVNTMDHVRQIAKRVRDLSIVAVLVVLVALYVQKQQHSTCDSHDSTDVAVDRDSDNIAILVKTGAVTIWDRMPTQIHTFLTQFSNISVYSDMEDDIYGYHVTNILSHASNDLKRSQDFRPYRQLQQLKNQHPFWQPNPRQIDKGWELDKYKNLLIFYHAWQKDDSKDWYLMIDDDTYVFKDNLLEFLSTLDPNNQIYTGLPNAGIRHIFAHGGSGILISRELMSIAFDRSKELLIERYTEMAMNELFGDYMVAVYLESEFNCRIDLAGIGHFNDESYYQLQTKPENFDKSLVTIHHATPKDMERMWNYERGRSSKTAKTSKITHYGVFSELIRPQLVVEKRDQWDNGAKDLGEFCYSCGKIHDPALAFNTSAPYASLGNCRDQCMQIAECVMYKYDFTRYMCGISASMALGKPVLGSNGNCSSYWLLERMDEQRH